VKYWINCLSENHVFAGIEGGFTQAATWNADPMRRLNAGDVVIFYSEGTTYRAGARLQAVTAMGRVAGKDPFQTKVTAKGGFIEIGEADGTLIAKAMKADLGQ
jgi:hypothetical protein